MPLLQRKIGVCPLHRDSILAGADPQELDDIVQEMEAVGLNLTVEGDISDFLGVQIDRINDNTFNLSQPHLINDVIKELHLDGKNVYRSLSHRPTVILYLSLRLATKFLNENPKCLRFCPKFSNRLSDDVIISLGSQFSLSGDVV
jgi:hypothetical protein